jgi:hypothetical protein
MLRLKKGGRREQGESRLPADDVGQNDAAA